MKLNQINSIVFDGKIIDSHGHVGHWKNNEGYIYDSTPDLDIFIKSNLDNGDSVEKVIVSNLDCMVNKSSEGKIELLSDEIAGNKKVLEISAKSSKLAPLATCQPGFGDVKNIKKLFEENPDKFIGLKFHPEETNVPANSDVYKPYMKFAQEKKLPCLFHSGNTFEVRYPDGGIAKASTVSKPEQIYELARKYRDVPVILAHWGGDGEQNYNKTTDLILDSLKKKDAKLFGDISWVDCNNPEKPNMKKIIERLKTEENGLDRILFGTDAAIGRFGGNGENGITPMKAYTDNVDNIKKMIKENFPDEAEKIIDKIFYKNANELFFKKAPGSSALANSNRKLGCVIAGSVLLSSVCGLYFYNKHNKFNNIEKIENVDIQKFDIKG